MESLRKAAKSLDKSVVGMSKGTEKDLKEGPDRFSHFPGAGMLSFTFGPSNVSNASEPIELVSVELPDLGEFVKSLCDIEGLDELERSLTEDQRRIEMRILRWSGEFESLKLESEYYPKEKEWWCSIGCGKSFSYQELFILWKALRTKSKAVYISEDMNDVYTPAFFYDFFLKGRLERKAKLCDPADRKKVEGMMRWFEAFLADS